MGGRLSLEDINKLSNDEILALDPEKEMKPDARERYIERKAEIEAQPVNPPDPVVKPKVIDNNKPGKENPPSGKDKGWAID